MAIKSKDGRYMPVLAVLLLLTLGAAAWLIFTLSNGPQSRPAAAEVLINSQAANIQVLRALDGDEQAWPALRNTSKALQSIKTAGLSEAQRASLGEVRKTVQAVLEGEGDVQALAAIVANIDEQVTKFSGAVYELEGELSIQRQSAVVANLERLRALGASLQASARALPEGDAELNRRIIDSEMELHQIVRGLQAGDPQLGLSAVSGSGSEQALAALARRAEQIGSVVADGLQLSDMLAPVRASAAQLDNLVMSMEGERIVFGNPSINPGLNVEYQRLLALLGAAAFVVLVMMFLWFRASGQRERTAQLAAETERDQQAILQLLDELGSLADGDLTVQATVSEDITGAIADSVNFAIEALRDLVATINTSAILVEDATRQTEASASALSRASQAQSRQIKEATEAIQQMAASIDEVSGNAERSADVARHSVDIAHKGGDAVRRTIEGMNTIRETIQETSKRIKRLGESTQEIGNIVELINDIADQTNILALNASIQASMAGEAGRGFAVVADEVQRLAERSANATRQIEVLVTTIQADTNEAVVSMERSTTDVVGGALLAENAGAALEEIEQVSNQIASLVQNISSSAREQSESSRQVLQSAEKLKSSSHEADVSATTTTNFISKLAALATQLRESVSGFILPASLRENAAGDGPGDAESRAEESDDDYGAPDGDAQEPNARESFLADERSA